MRGFGFVYDTFTGHSRSWYSAADGIKRWTDNDEAVPDTTTPPRCITHHEDEEE